jgi:4-amino-4-deoxy-L-arabinose transferase-like glycosyltransferase
MGGHRLLLAGILAASVVLRFWNLDAPPMSADESLHYFPEMQHIHLLPFSEQRAHPTFLYHATPPNPMGHPAFAIQLTNMAMRLFSATPEVGRGVMALSGCLLVFAAFLLGRDLFSREHGIAAAAIACLLPLAVRYQRTLYLDSVYSLLTGAFAWCLFRSLESSRLAWPMASGTLLGLAAATKTSAPLLVLLAIAYPALVWWRARNAAPVKDSGGWSLLFKMSLVLTLSVLVFCVLVSPASYVESIRNPADTAYRDRSLAFYLAHLWTRRAWVVGVGLFLLTPPVLLAAVAGLAHIAARWGEARQGDTLVLLWLVATGPLLFLHLGGLSGEHGYLSFVLPVALLAAAGVNALPREWRRFAWALILAATIPAAILYGHRLAPTPYDSYLNSVDR